MITRTPTKLMQRLVAAMEADYAGGGSGSGAAGPPTPPIRYEPELMKTIAVFPANGDIYGIIARHLEGVFDVDSMTTSVMRELSQVRADSGDDPNTFQTISGQADWQSLVQQTLELVLSLKLPHLQRAMEDYYTSEKQAVAGTDNAIPDDWEAKTAQALGQAVIDAFSDQIQFQRDMDVSTVTRLMEHTAINREVAEIVISNATYNQIRNQVGNASRPSGGTWSDDVKEAVYYLVTQQVDAYCNEWRMGQNKTEGLTASGLMTKLYRDLIPNWIWSNFDGAEEMQAAMDALDPPADNFEDYKQRSGAGEAIAAQEALEEAAEAAQ